MQDFTDKADNAVGPTGEVHAVWYNGIENEIINAIKDAGLVPSKDDHEQLLKAIKTIAVPKLWTCQMEGSNYKIVTTAKDIDLIDTQMLFFIAPQKNAGAITLTFKTTTADIKSYKTKVSLTGDEINENRITIILYKDAGFHLIETHEEAKAATPYDDAAVKADIIANEALIAANKTDIAANKTAIDNAPDAQDLSEYLHVKKGAYDLNYDGGEFLEMSANFSGAYNGGYGANLVITACKNQRAVPIFGHRTCADFAQDKSAVGDNTLLHVPIVIGANKFWRAKKSFGFTFAIEYAGATTPDMLHQVTGAIESKSGITGDVPVKNLGTKTHSGRTYSYFLGRVDYKLDDDFSDPTIEVIVSFVSARLSGKMEIIAYNGYMFEGLTEARYNAADLTTNFHFPANPKFDHRTFDDTTDGDTVIAGYTHDETDDKEVRLPTNVKISRENLDSGVQHKVGYDRNLKQVSAIYVGEYNSDSTSWTTFERDSEIMDLKNPLVHTKHARYELMTFNFSENFPSGWFVFRFRIITTVDCSLIIANTDSHGDGVEGKYGYRYFDDNTGAYPRISKANKSFFARCVAGDNRIDVFMINNGTDVLFKDSKSMNFNISGKNESYEFAKTVCGYHILDAPNVRAGKNPEQVIDTTLKIKLQSWSNTIPNLQTNSFVEFKREISA